uniref:Sulfate_transp domain-containing protein n=1 Tax=Macrostomum lignano TaxID=282301 RepID=A0A1I8F722_9PLAT
MDNQGAAGQRWLIKNDLTEKFCKKSAADSANQSSSDSREMSAKKVDYTALVAQDCGGWGDYLLGCTSFPDGFAAFAGTNIRHQQPAPAPGRAGASWRGRSGPSKATKSNCSRADDDDDSLAPSDAETERSVRVLRPVSTQHSLTIDTAVGWFRQPLLAPAAGQAEVEPRPAVHPDRGRCWRELARPCSCCRFWASCESTTCGEWLLPDHHLGLTGMAYAFLAELPPYWALYTSFFPPLIYFFFAQIAPDLHGHLGDRLSALIGSLLVSWASCDCGFLTRYLSDPLISGFTMGSRARVQAAQIKYVLGISVRRNGLASLPAALLRSGLQHWSDQFCHPAGHRGRCRT